MWPRFEGEAGLLLPLFADSARLSGIGRRGGEGYGAVIGGARLRVQGGAGQVFGARGMVGLVVGQGLRQVSNRCSAAVRAPDSASATAWLSATTGGMSL